MSSTSKYSKWIYMIFECHVSYSCNLYVIISPIYRAFAKYRKKRKIHRTFWKDFTVDEAEFILKQPFGNDHSGFYVMHYMHCRTGDEIDEAMVCMKWFYINMCSYVLNYLTCLISYYCVIFFRTMSWVQVNCSWAS